MEGRNQQQEQESVPVRKDDEGLAKGEGGGMEEEIEGCGGNEKTGDCDVLEGSGEGGAVVNGGECGLIADGMGQADGYMEMFDQRTTANAAIGRQLGASALEGAGGRQRWLIQFQVTAFPIRSSGSGSSNIRTVRTLDGIPRATGFRGRVLVGVNTMGGIASDGPQAFYGGGWGLQVGRDGNSGGARKMVRAIYGRPGAGGHPATQYFHQCLREGGGCLREGF